MADIDAMVEMIRSLNVMDDALFQKVVEDAGACEEILRVVLGDGALHVEEVVPQKSLRNLGARSVELDALCTLGDGTLVAVEMQKRDDDDHPRRVRYVRSNVDTFLAEKGLRFADVPRVTVAFMSRFDTFGAGRTTYHVDKVVRETGEPLDDGTLDVYVNAAVNDGSKAARLMAYMARSAGRSDEFPAVSGRVMYFKESSEGRAEMSDLIEEYAQRKAAKAAAEGITAGVVAACKGLGATVSDAVARLVEGFGMDQAEAERVVKACW